MATVYKFSSDRPEWRQVEQKENGSVKTVVRYKSGIRRQRMIKGENKFCAGTYRDGKPENFDNAEPYIV